MLELHICFFVFVCIELATNGIGVVSDAVETGIAREVGSGQLRLHIGRICMLVSRAVLQLDLAQQIREGVTLGNLYTKVQWEGKVAHCGGHPLTYSSVCYVQNYRVRDVTPTHDKGDEGGEYAQHERGTFLTTPFEQFTLQPAVYSYLNRSPAMRGRIPSITICRKSQPSAAR